MKNKVLMSIFSQLYNKINCCCCEGKCYYKRDKTYEYTRL